jgi:predicted DNA-binding transcriptional regulator AlpA
MLAKEGYMSGATNRTSYAFESDPSNRKPPTAETSDWAPNSRGPSHQTESSAHGGVHTEAPSPRIVSFPIPERLLNAREVAARLGVSERWVRDHTTRRAPKLRGVKLGSLMRYRNVDVEDFMEKLATSRSSLQPRFGG